MKRNVALSVLVAGGIAVAPFIAPREAVAQTKPALNLKVSYGTPADHPYGMGVAKFGEVVKDRTGGRVTVVGFPSGQLGAEVPSIYSAQSGVLEMALTSSAALAGVEKSFGLLDLPYLFESEQEADRVLDGPAGEALLTRLTPKNLIGLCFWEAGFHQLTNSRRPVRKLEDFNGLKIRTIQNSIMVDTMSAFGALPVPMPFTELHPALETKALDGLTAAYTVTYSAKLHELQKYITATRHVYTPIVLMMSKMHWDKLAAEDQAILRAACAEARGVQRAENRKLGPVALKAMRDSGLAYDEFTPEELARVKAKLKPVSDKHINEFDAELAARFTSEIAKARGATN